MKYKLSEQPGIEPYSINNRVDCTDAVRRAILKAVGHSLEADCDVLVSDTLWEGAVQFMDIRCVGGRFFVTKAFGENQRLIDIQNEHQSRYNRLDLVIQARHANYHHEGNHSPCMGLRAETTKSDIRVQTEGLALGAEVNGWFNAIDAQCSWGQTGFIGRQLNATRGCHINGDSNWSHDFMLTSNPMHSDLGIDSLSMQNGKGLITHARNVVIGRLRMEHSQFQKDFPLEIDHCKRVEMNVTVDNVDKYPNLRFARVGNVMQLEVRGVVNSNEVTESNQRYIPVHLEMAQTKANFDGLVAGWRF